MALNKPDINPNDLFAFLEGHDDYPVSGQHLADTARAEGAEPELVEFFDALPGTLANESEVVKHAVDPNESPMGRTLDFSNGTEETKPPTDVTLNLDEIVDGGGQ